jgi:hypothetical protein
MTASRFFRSIAIFAALGVFGGMLTAALSGQTTPPPVTEHSTPSPAAPSPSPAPEASVTEPTARPAPTVEPTPSAVGHLEASNASCAACHDCLTPSHEVPCLKECGRPRNDEFRSRMDTKKQPEGVIILDALSRRNAATNEKDHFGPVPFDHGGHAKWAEIAGGCTVCHHYTPEGAAHPACDSCHEVDNKHEDLRKPGLKGAFHRQCLNCHREWSHETSCDVCHLPRVGAEGVAPKAGMATKDDLLGRMHPPIAAPKEELYKTNFPEGSSTQVFFNHERHADAYGLACAECHQGDSCARCHEDGTTHTQRIRTLSDHHQPCSLCHTVTEQDRCAACHVAEGGTAPAAFDHAKTGWPLNRFHAGENCRACHKDTPFKALDTSCNACHKDWAPGSFDHKVTGQPLDETHSEIACDQCHKASDFTKPPTCTECHDADDGFVFPTKRPGPAPKP